MVTSVEARPASGVRRDVGRSEAGKARVTIAVVAAGIATFALLYAPQAVLPQIAQAFRLDAGGASLAVSVASAGLAVAVLPIATLSELIGRRPVMVASLVLSVTLGLIIPFIGDYQTLLVLRGLQGAAIAGFPGVGAAFLVERLGAAGVAGAVGAMVAGNTIGGMFGRLASGFTTGPLGWQGALLCAALISAGCAVIAIFALFYAGPPAPHADQRPARARSLLSGVGSAMKARVLVAQYGVALLGMGAFVALYNAAAFRLVEPPLSLAPAVASLVFLAYALGALSSSFAGIVVRRFGRVVPLIGSLLCTVLGALITLSDALPLVALGMAILTAGFFCAHAVSSGWTAAAARPGERGQASGLYTLAYYVGGSIGGTVGSVVYAVAGWGALIALISGWLVIAALGVLAVRRAGARVPAGRSAGS